MDDTFHSERTVCTPDSDGEWTDEGDDGGAQGEGEEGGKSVTLTLRDILLQAGETTRDLLGSFRSFILPPSLFFLFHFRFLVLRY